MDVKDNVFKHKDYISPECVVFNLELQGIIAGSSDGMKLKDNWEEEDW